MNFWRNASLPVVSLLLMNLRYIMLFCLIDCRIPFVNHGFFNSCFYLMLSFVIGALCQANVLFYLEKVYKTSWRLVYVEKIDFPNLFFWGLKEIFLLKFLKFLWRVSCFESDAIECYGRIRNWPKWSDIVLIIFPEIVSSVITLLIILSISVWLLLVNLVVEVMWGIR